MSMEEIEIGIGKRARIGYELRELSVIPSRRTRDIDDVDVSWQLEGYNFTFPIIASPMDSLVSPQSAVHYGELGGLAVLDLEGLWARHENADELLDRMSSMTTEQVNESLRGLYSVPVKKELMAELIKKVVDEGQVACGSVSPKNVASLAPAAAEAGLDILLIHGLVVSAEHICSSPDPLDLGRFVRELDIPVLIGGCASYQNALHLMRTGASGVLVGVGAGSSSRSKDFLGLGVPQATAIADVVGARTRHLEETGFYVQVIADGGMTTAGDMVKAIACGADAVMVGLPLAKAKEAPAKNWYFGSSFHHEYSPRGILLETKSDLPMREILFGPVKRNAGDTNLVGAMKRAMATCGAQTLKELQKTELVVGRQYNGK